MANNRIQIKRTSTSARTPNTSDPANTQYIAPGELALNMTDKILYTSDGSNLITIGATQTTITATTVNLTDNITIGDIGSSQLVVNSTAVFAGNSTVNSSVNTISIAVRDPDHFSSIAADIIEVSNNTSNSRVTPALLFVGNSAANAQFNMIGGSSSLSIINYSYDAAAGLVVFTTSTVHNFTTPLRGTIVTITGLTGVLASVINGIPYEVASIPTTTSFTVRKDLGKSIKYTSRSSSGVATLYMPEHTFAVGQSINVRGAGTDAKIPSLTYDGTYTLTASVTSGGFAPYVQYNNFTATPTTITSMFIPYDPGSAYTAASSGPLTFIASGGHSYTDGQPLVGIISTTANSTITYIGYKSSTTSTDENGNRTGSIAYIATSASVANIYSTGMQLDVLAPNSSVTSAASSWSGVVTKIETSQSIKWSDSNPYNGVVMKITLSSTSSTIPSSVYSKGSITLNITNFLAPFDKYNGSWSITVNKTVIPDPVYNPTTGKYIYTITAGNEIWYRGNNLVFPQGVLTFGYGIGAGSPATVSFSIGGTVYNYGGGTLVSATGTVAAIGPLLQGSTTFTASGTSVTAAGTYASKTQSTTSGVGTGAVFTITKTGSGTSYNGAITVTVTTAGSKYAIGDTIKIFGTNLGGTTPANDLTLTVGTALGLPCDGIITNMARTTGLVAGSLITATPGSGSINGGTPYTAKVLAVTNSSSITYSVASDATVTSPTPGTVTNITTRAAKIIMQGPAGVGLLSAPFTTYANSFFVSGLIPGIATDFNFISYSGQETRFGNSSVICFPAQSTTYVSADQKVAVIDSKKYLTSNTTVTNHNWRTWTVVSPGANFIADHSSSATSITVKSISQGVIKIGQNITGPATIPLNTYITGQSSGTTGGVGIYTISQTTTATATVSGSFIGAFTITPDDSEILTSFQSTLTTLGVSAVKTQPEFIPLTALSASPNKTYFTFYKNFNTGTGLTYVNSTAFTIPYSEDLPKFGGYFGNSSASIPITTGSLYYSITRDFTGAPSAARISIEVPTTSVTGVTASTNFSSYVEIANSSAAIKMTPTTFYIGNTSANLFSNSSFLGISSSSQILEISPGQIFIANAVNGIPDATKGYFFANSSGTYIGNATKFTYFDGAGNQINKGSSITVGTESGNVYVNDYSITINGDNSQTLVNTSIASFSGNVVIAGPLSTNGTYGQAGDVLYSTGESTYWAQPVSNDIFSNTVQFSNTSQFNDAVTVNAKLSVSGNPIEVNYYDSTLTTPYYNTSTYSHDRLTINTTTDLQNYELATLSTNTLQIIANNAAVTVGNSTVNTIVNSSAVYINGKFGFANSSTSSIAYTYYNASANSVDTIFG